MADGSAIEWTHSTWNPVTGCTKVSAGCDNCYAERFSERFRGVAGHPFENGFDLTLRPERIDQPKHWRRPRLTFVHSMSDLYCLIVKKHILPVLGRMPALAVEHSHATELHHWLRATPTRANQLVDTLSRIYSAAGDRCQIPEACSPCRLVAKNRERKRERFLTDAELRRLGAVLDGAGRMKGISVHAAAIRLLLLTGCRTEPCGGTRWTWKRGS